jgi:sugar lactone lactonase YvrE
VDTSGTVYVADHSNHRIRKVSAAGVVTTLAGSGTATFADGVGTSASFYYPWSVAVDANGTVYVAGSNRIRKITSAGVVTTLAGSGSYAFADGTGASASFYSPEGVAVDAFGAVYVADSNNGRIRKISSQGVVTTLAGSGNWDFADGTGASASFYSPSGVAVGANGTVYVADPWAQRIRIIQ